MATEVTNIGMSDRTLLVPTFLAANLMDLRFDKHPGVNVVLLFGLRIEAHAEVHRAHDIDVRAVPSIEANTEVHRANDIDVRVVPSIDICTG